MAPPRGHPRWGGRTKGRPNHVTTEAREKILRALDDLGGVAYLVQQGRENPQAFMSLLGRTLPRDMNVAIGTSLEDLLAKARRPDPPATVPPPA